MHNQMLNILGFTHLPPVQVLLVENLQNVSAVEA